MRACISLRKFETIQVLQNELIYGAYTLNWASRMSQAFVHPCDYRAPCNDSAPEQPGSTFSSVETTRTLYDDKSAARISYFKRANWVSFDFNVAFTPLAEVTP